jgi:uncharacterized protein YqgV (UPF0045/DUF77 family)
MAIVAVSIAPVGTGSTSVSQYVAETQRVLKRHPRLKYHLDPMFTNIEEASSSRAPGADVL